MKRLIVLCDGTWQDSTTAEANKFPTNVTRMARALSQCGVEKNSEKVPQLIYYQPGVGTGDGIKVRGGVYGAGLSSNIRAAYGFLAHNYEKGDKMYFFGFSRGAYTARSIAGLITTLGLLTKRGMDKFQPIYQQYFEHGAGQKEPRFDKGLLKSLRDSGDLLEEARDAVEIIGVWDTVGFHGDKFFGETLQFYNCLLSRRVKHAYHALSLDERRWAFRPTLWEVPKLDASDDKPRTQEMQQVWFSGTHSEVGGGLIDCRLPNISLAWMVAQCARDNKLSFTDVDLLQHSESHQASFFSHSSSNDNGGGHGFSSYYLLDPAKSTPTSTWHVRSSISPTGLGERAWGLADSIMTSLIPRPIRSWIPLVNGARAPMSLATMTTDTLEKIHVSVRDRKFEQWWCGPLTGMHDDNATTGGNKEWHLRDSSLPPLEEAPVDPVEEVLRGRLRTLI